MRLISTRRDMYGGEKSGGRREKRNKIKEVEERGQKTSGEQKKERCTSTMMKEYKNMDN